MKTDCVSRVLCSAVFAFIFLILAGIRAYALAPVDFVSYSFDENGNGSITIFVGGYPLIGGPLDSTTSQPDAGPGGLSNPLTYDLNAPPSIISGDLFLTDALGGTSDVIRFNPTGGSSSGGPSLVFYSLAGGTDLADTGFPTANYANTVSITEDELSGTLYVPTAGQPGYVDGFLVGYQFVSGPISGPVTGVPDSGSTSMLLGCGVMVMIVVWRLSLRVVEVTELSHNGHKISLRDNEI